MAFTIDPKRCNISKFMHGFLIALLSLLIITPVMGEYFSALPTRDQTPLLQSYFIPAMPAPSGAGWSVSHALYFTNTYQTDRSVSENLVIDVENTRYDFQLNYRQDLWQFNLNIPLLSNRAGFLDQTIEGWHDVFGLPQGGRDKNPNDRINLLYEKSGTVVIDSQQPSEGVGDIQLASGYQLTPQSQLWFALEVPSSSSSDFISNQSTDWAIWYRLNRANTSSKLKAFGAIGLAFPADSGLFEGRVNDQFGFAQFGLNYAISDGIAFILQSDFHTAIVEDSDLDALGNSIQAQFGLGFDQLIPKHHIELFFSEDILPGHAPDITFGLRVFPFTGNNSN